MDKNAVERLRWEMERVHQPVRRSGCHKYDCGHVLVVGGAPGFSGAARLAAESALRVGAGVVSVATHPFHSAVLNMGRPELMCHGVETLITGFNGLFKVNALVVGPGLGREAWGQLLFDEVLSLNKPLLIDGDALYLLSRQRGKHRFLPESALMTPHSGEAARLIDQTPLWVESHPLETVEQLHQRYGTTVLLKGKTTTIFDGTKIYQHEFDQPSMATAGMGDVLSGLIGGLWVQGLSLMQATQLGVLVQSRAAEWVMHSEGSVGLMASDLWKGIKPILNS
jgi:ADP-dependent NAD(P)H-hydrate dehydratase / NAD(P)H-hydrate epimerase